MDYTYDHEFVKTNANLPARYFFSNDQKPTFVLPHYHNELEIIYIINGNLYVTAGTHNFSLYSGDIVIFNANEIHSTKTSNDYTTAYVLQISNSFVKTICNCSQDYYFSVPLLSSDSTSKEERANIFQLQETIREFFTASENDTAYGYIYLQSILCKIIYHLCEKHIDCQSVINYKEFKRITDIEAFLNNRYTEPVSLLDISDHMGLSPTYFSKYFRRTFGVTFCHYLCSLRLKKAHEDLVATNDPLLHISEKNGFANYQLFTSSFKEAYGCTPSQYRREYINDN